MDQHKTEMGLLQLQIENLIKEISSYKKLLEEQRDRIKQKSLTKMLVKSNGRLIIIHSHDIDWIEAWGDYVRIHCKEKAFIIRQKISDIEMRLDKQQFLRIGRSAIINVDCIKEMEPLNHGDYLITLQNNTQLNLSRNFRECLSLMFDHYL